MISEQTLLEFDISHELWREYEFGTDDSRTIYLIVKPKTLFIHPGGSTHRVADSNGVTHCAPRPGLDGCVVRWLNPPEHPRARF